jgi:hypothetical protein
MNHTYRQIIIGMALHVSIMLSMLAGVIVLFFHSFDFMLTMTGALLAVPLPWPAQLLIGAIALLSVNNFLYVLSEIASAVAGFFSGAKTV